MTTEAELDFRLFFEASPEVLVVLLPDAPRYTQIAATRARYAATLTTPEQTLGVGIFELFPDNPADESANGEWSLRASLDRVVATRAPDTMAVQKYDIRMPDGTFAARHWSPRNIPILGAKGELRYILHCVEDVTELVRASELGDALRDRTRSVEREVVARSHELAAALVELRAANAKLGELDAAKTAFFSNVSHELRTPLTLMLGPLEQLASSIHPPLAPAQRALVSLAHDSAMRMLKLVNALLDFASLEAGRVRLAFEPVELARVTAELSAMFTSAFERANVELAVDCSPLSEPIYVDRGAWEKIVPNLVSNALKFTHQGRVCVHLSESDTEAILVVEDTGIGIPEAELPRIFERFHRVRGAAGRTHEGTGIGLSLVRELVALHGGRVDIESRLGRGTRVSVRVPKGKAHLPPDALLSPRVVPVDAATVAHAVEAERWTPSTAPSRLEPSTSRPPASVHPPAARVLVVDDSADLRQYIAGLLAPRFDVALAVDGLDALERARAVPPDLVVSDVMMPRLDGLGLVRALRADPVTRTIPVILLSARAGEESAVEGLDVGADDYLIKPFAATELVARVRAHVTQARVRAQLIRELEHANRELDAFAYAVSHDLRAPLRAVEGFTRALDEDYGGSLDERGRDYLARIVRGAARMSALIDDMLALSRVSRAPLTRTVVDLGALADDVVRELRRSHPEREVEVVIEPELECRADRGLMMIALTNLLRNAWKFTSKNSGTAHITVGRAGGTAEPVFFVRDDGTGFDMARAGALFAPFHRLHAASEFEGTGIGLATVKRVAARHGGRVWAEAEVGRGATFYVAIPQNDGSH